MSDSTPTSDAPIETDWPQSLREKLRFGAGRTELTQFDPEETPILHGNGKADADELISALEPAMDGLQERLYAQGRVHPESAPSVLLVLQGMDTAGKGGVIRHVIGLVDPQGVQIASFKAPTIEERKHDFLWRIRKALPARGQIGIFDRSHYEDVLIQRVEQMASPEVIESRYQQINDFEAELHAQGTTVIKCFLQISREEQKKRLLARLTDPEKHWKYNPGDLEARSKWEEYAQAYQIALTRCSTPQAPWYVVPADRKWYRNWAVARLLVETMGELDLSWPEADFDVAAELERVRAS